MRNLLYTHTYINFFHDFSILFYQFFYKFVYIISFFCYSRYSTYIDHYLIEKTHVITKLIFPDIYHTYTTHTHTYIYIYIYIFFFFIFLYFAFVTSCDRQYLFLIITCAKLIKRQSYL